MPERSRPRFAAATVAILLFACRVAPAAPLQLHEDRQPRPAPVPPVAVSISPEQRQIIQDLRREASAGRVDVIVSIALPRELKLTELEPRQRASAVGEVLDGFLLGSFGRRLEAGEDRLDSFPFLKLVVDAAELELLVVLLQEGRIESIEPNRKMSAHGSAPMGLADPLSSAIDKIGASDAWKKGYTGAGWTIVVLDSGVHHTNWAFRDHKHVGPTPFRVRAGSRYQDPNEAKAEPAPQACDGDPGSGSCSGPMDDPTPTQGDPLPGYSGADAEHGTGMAGVAAACPLPLPGPVAAPFGPITIEASWVFDPWQSGSLLQLLAEALKWFLLKLWLAMSQVLAQGRGVAPEADLISIRVFTLYKTGKFEVEEFSVMHALEEVHKLRIALQQIPIAVVNMSFGDKTFSQGHCSSSLSAIVQELRDASVAVVASTGNDGQDMLLPFPACVQGVIPVSMCDKQDQHQIGNVTPTVQLAGPGWFVLVPKGPGSGTGGVGSTSEAAALVSGAIALLRSSAPEASVDALVDALVAGGVDCTNEPAGVALKRIWIPGALAELSSQ